MNGLVSNKSCNAVALLGQLILLPIVTLSPITNLIMTLRILVVVTKQRCCNQDFCFIQMSCDCIVNGEMALSFDLNLPQTYTTSQHSLCIRECGSTLYLGLITPYP